MLYLKETSDSCSEFKLFLTGKATKKKANIKTDPRICRIIKQENSHKYLLTRANKPLQSVRRLVSHTCVSY